MRRILEDIVILVGLSSLNFSDLFSDALESIYKSVHLDLIFRLGGLNHESADDWERYGGGMETVVHQSLRNVLLSDVSSFLEFSHVKNELMSDSSLLTLVENFIGAFELIRYVVSTHDSVLG